MKLCLVGNQNCGKTTLFNLLTGMNQKIGNWPGVTIEKKTGIIKNTEYELVDLPGIYSLMPYTEEEKVTRDYILTENPDLIINIIDATHLERSLYLTVQLLEIGCNVIIALNMIDILNKNGIYIDSTKMQQELSCKVYEISALKNIGIDNLIDGIKLEMANLNVLQYSKMMNYRKLIECRNIEEYEKRATERYNYISKIKLRFWNKKRKWINNTDFLDKIFLHKYLAIPIFMVIMFMIYFVSVGIVGKYSVDFVNDCICKFSTAIKISLMNMNTSEWIQSLILNGIVQGVGSVISFVPQLMILFLCISILETTGYMSRIAFLLDNIFRKIGLSGKSLIPFIVGTGCSVPGIMSAKIIENNDEKKMTAILVPFIPCSAKLPIISLFAGYFFEQNSGIVSASLYFLSIVVIIFSSLIMKKFIFVNTTTSFITELPAYQLPSIRYMMRNVLERTIEFIKRAGTTIFIASIIIWFLLSFSIYSKNGELKLCFGNQIEESIFATIGKKFSFIFYPIIGANSWELTISAMQGLIAKEQVVSSMSIISGLNGENTIFSLFTPVSAYAYVAFNLFCAPCLAAIGAMKKELGNFKNMMLAICFQCALAWIVAVFINMVGSMYG